MISSVQMNSHFLYKIALEAYQRTTTPMSDTAAGQLDTVVSVVFSSATLEAFMDDAVALAELFLSSSCCTEPTSVSAFADALKEIEKHRGSVKLKYMVGRIIFAGKPYDKGAPPYQDFALLIELRNALVHMETKQMSGLWETKQISGKFRSGKMSVYSDYIKPALPGMVKKLPQDLLAGDDYTYWINRICTPALARWACNTAVSMIKSFVDTIPDSSLSGILAEMVNGGSFESV